MALGIEGCLVPFVDCIPHKIRFLCMILMRKQRYEMSNFARLLPTRCVLCFLSCPALKKGSRYEQVSIRAILKEKNFPRDEARLIVISELSIMYIFGVTGQKPGTSLKLYSTT